MDKLKILRGIKAYSHLIELHAEIYDSYIAIKGDFRKLGIDFRQEEEFRHIILEVDGFLKNPYAGILHAPHLYSTISRQYEELLEDAIDTLNRHCESKSGIQISSIESRLMN